MQKFNSLKSIPAYLPIVNIDTDMIIPKQFLKTIKRTGLGKNLFFEMRYDDNGSEIKDFTLNQLPYSKSKILISGKNFGCGSSREHAPWALLDFGITCVISSSYADIFYNNCFKNGILPIILEEDKIKELSEYSKRKEEIAIDLKEEKIVFGNTEIKFEIDAFKKKCLLEGLDDIALSIKKSELGLNPQIDGQLIRIPIPDLSEERRTELKKIIKTLGEKNKISIRNIRREANDELKSLLKDKKISEDENEKYEKEIKKMGQDREDLISAIIKLKSSINELNQKGRERLIEAFDKVNRKFNEVYTKLFNGGNAKLELVDSDDPLEAGLEMLVSPPGKRLQSITLLSGGEQALTALSLVFAVFLTSPAPICVLDEVDAPLDDANVTRFCNLLEELVRITRTKFIIVTHHALTMSKMDRLYGVTMPEKGISQLVAVDLQKAEELVA